MASVEGYCTVLGKKEDGGNGVTAQSQTIMREEVGQVNVMEGGGL